MVCVDSVNVTPSNVTLKIGEWYYDANAEVLPSNATCSNIEWYSENTGIASVNASNGYIYANGIGTTKIYARATDGSGKSDYITVTVISNVEVKITPSSLTLGVGRSAYLEATVSPGGTKQSVTWSSSNTSIATVNPDSGLVLAQSVGDAIIYATAQDGSDVTASCPVSVKPSVQSFTISPTNIAMDIGDTITMSATVLPTDAINKEVKWGSSDDTIATVDLNSGVVTAISGGTVTIWGVTTDGAFSADCTVIVACGGVDYKDVTKHNMVLQDDGYYVCSVCKYRVKSPLLQDKYILSTEDFYKVWGCYLAIPYYAAIDGVKNGNYSIRVDSLLSKIDDIRSQIQYASQYEYADENGLCKRQHTVENKNQDFYMPMTVNYTVIDNDGERLWHSGFFDDLIELCIGFLIPPQYEGIFTDILSCSVYDCVEDLIWEIIEEIYGEDIVKILKVANLGLSIDDTYIRITDRVVDISFLVGAATYNSKITFSSNGFFKKIEHGVK